MNSRIAMIWKGFVVKDIAFAFEVHQPFRVRRDFFWGRLNFCLLGVEGLFEYYFDDEVNKSIFRRVAEKAYLPAATDHVEFICQTYHDSSAGSWKPRLHER